MRILPSKRSCLYVLERARVYCRDGRVEYFSDEGREAAGFNIPVANTCFLLLGPGSSITQEAVRLLRQEGVCIGFCGSGGTPLLSAQDPYPDMLLPADEYRDPGHLVRWVEVWRDDARRLKAAKSLFRLRLEQIEHCWPRLSLEGPMPDAPERAMDRASTNAERASSTAELLGIEGVLTKELYVTAAKITGQIDFERVHGGAQGDFGPNRLLDHGNYLAYGMASVVLWTLGIPASMALVHGKTRRGGLVFDLADVIKDACVLPVAFNVAARVRDGQMEKSETAFRALCIRALQDMKAMDVMFGAIRDILNED